jgi:hypothetical protein
VGGRTYVLGTDRPERFLLDGYTGLGIAAPALFLAELDGGS